MVAHFDLDDPQLWQKRVFTSYNMYVDQVGQKMIPLLRLLVHFNLR